MSASKDFSDIQRMLNECAPGHTIRLSDHFRRVKFGALFYPSLPKSKTIEVGHIHKMVRHLHIEDCAKKHGMFK
jgi:hypothetical protein